MATQGSRDNKRVNIYWELDKAVKELRKLGDPLIQVGQGLEALGKALKSLRYAAERAKPTVHQWEDEKGQHIKVSRDGLPQRVRARAAKLATLVEALATEVKGLPVTPEQKVLAKVARAKAHTSPKGANRGTQK